MINKLRYLVAEICRENNDLAALNVIENSEFRPAILQSNYRWDSDSYNLFFDVNPQVYIKNVNHLDRISNTIRHYFNEVADPDKIYFDKVIIKPNYGKITVLNSKISIIITPWEEINSLQQELIEQMKIASSSIDFQNIGNSARSILDKLSRIVFDSKTHIAPNGIDVSNGKFKNQLHTYIETVLAGAQNKELRRFSRSSVDFTEKSIDLMNQTTHKLDVQIHFAEVCVISTISVISLLKAINEL
jgi:hypothetical protein